MREANRKKRNEQLLMELHPNFRARVSKMIDTLEAAGFRPRIADAWRSVAKQERLFDEMKTLTKFGFHNITTNDGNPNAMAVDLIDDDDPFGTSTNYILHLAAAAEAVGLETGIRWNVPDQLVGAIDAAIAAQDWDADVKIGWDPKHVQPAGITIAEARGGARPA